MRPGLWKNDALFDDIKSRVKDENAIKTYV